MSFSVSYIAAVLGVKHWRLAYIIRREKIEPDWRRGMTRFFGERKARRIVAACGIARRPGRPRKQDTQL